MDPITPAVNPDAAFDSLVLADRLQRDRSRFQPAEIHLFAYLGCLLWLYRDRIAADWGYSFVGTSLGAPYSPQIGTAIHEMLTRGVLTRHRDGMALSANAPARLRTFENLAFNQPRLECLLAACSSTAALSPGIVNNALSDEPELRRARTFPSNRPLLEDLATSQLFGHFAALRKGLGARDVDLRVPAVVWLTALHQSSRRTNR